MRYNKRTDKCQSEIVEHFRRQGWQCIVTNFGQGFPDLLVAGHGNWLLLEVKDDDGTIDRNQLKFLAEAKGYVGIVTPDIQVWKRIEDAGRLYLNLGEQHLITQWLITNATQQSLSVKKFFKLIGR